MIDEAQFSTIWLRIEIEFMIEIHPSMHEVQKRRGWVGDVEHRRDGGRKWMWRKAEVFFRLWHSVSNYFFHLSNSISRSLTLRNQFL